MELNCTKCGEHVLGTTYLAVHPQTLEQAWKCKNCSHYNSMRDMLMKQYGTTDANELQNIDLKERAPLGPIPRHIHDGRRIKHLLETMRDFAQKEKPVKIEWVDELIELLYKE
jgi:hypothetical protein